MLQLHQMKEKILIVGSGAREHAMGWQMMQHDQGNRELFFAPGNGGTSQIGQNVDIGVDEIDRLQAFAHDEEIDFTVVGPERPLANGIVNAFQKENLTIFGHTKEAAILESDKAEAVLFMRRHNIPHPDSAIFTDPLEAEFFIQNNPWEDIVIKASGLAEGKGVVLPDSKEEGIDVVRRMMIDKDFGDAGDKIVIQERLKGEEVSVIGFVSNEIGLLVPAQDYKRAYDGDKGPNTGGMGAYAPNTNISQEQLDEVCKSILLPTKEGMEQEGRPLTGAIYAGLMMTEAGIKVIEYNVRFGDPETQVQMRLLQSDLLKSMKATVEGRLAEEDYRSGSDASVGVVLASGGYPGDYEAGKRIHGADRDYGRDVVIFHAGTNRVCGELFSSGGRVLTVTATGKTKEAATEKIYNVVCDDGVSLDEGFYRRDISN